MYKPLFIFINLCTLHNINYKNVTSFNETLEWFLYNINIQPY